MKLALAATEIRNKTYGVGRVVMEAGPIIVPRIKVKAGAATYVGLIKDCAYWLTQHGLSAQEAKTFIEEGLQRFDERNELEQNARRESRNN